MHCNPIHIHLIIVDPCATLMEVSPGYNKTSERWHGSWDKPEASTLQRNGGTSSSRSSSLSDKDSSRSFSSDSVQRPSHAQPSCPSIYYPRSSMRIKTPVDIDLAKLNFVRGKLYGRERESRALQNALCTIAGQQSVVVLVDGVSGVGKSALVETLATKTRQLDGIYVGGKYDFQAHDTPYQGITQACRQACLELQRKNVSSKQLEQLRKEMGSSLFVLGALLSPLLEILGVGATSKGDSLSKLAEHTSSHVNDAQNRLIFALKCFLRIVSSWGPFVLVLDDLQWADAESFQLLKSIVNDNQGLSGFLLVGCYRTNEVDKGHCLSEWVRGMEQAKSDITLTRIHLLDLDVTDVNDMLADVLHAEVNDTQPLAVVVHRKTNGNAFFLVQYLKRLQEEDMLKFSIGLMTWIWNVEDIDTRSHATDNVVSLIQSKMGGLSTELCEILPVAACLGSSFTSRFLSIVVKEFQRGRENLRPADNNEYNQISPSQFLQVCLEEGFIEKRSHTDKYDWIHDRVLEAALELVPDDKIQKLQFRVGNALLDNLPSNEITEHIMLLTNLLNHGLDDDGAKGSMGLLLARLNLEAGAVTVKSASFTQALDYFQKGIACLPVHHWHNENELSLELFSSAAEAAHGCGDTASTEAYCSEVIDQPHRSITEKLRVYSVLISSIGNRNNLQEACDLFLYVLEQLGCTIPRYGRRFSVISGIYWAKSLVRKCKLRDLLTHKAMEKSKGQILQLLQKLAFSAYFLDGSLLVPLGILKALRLTAEYGLTEFTPTVFALVGMILATRAGDTICSRGYAELSLSMLEADPVYHAEVESRTLMLVYCTILHSNLPIQACLKPLLRGYSSGMATGDLENAFYCITYYMEFSYHQGKNLEDLDHDFAQYTREMKTSNHLRNYNYALFTWQVILNLRGKAEDPTVLKGCVFDIDTLENSKTHPGMVTRFRQVDLAYFMADDAVGASISLQLRKHTKASDLKRNVFNFNLFQARSAILGFGAARKTKEQKYAIHAKQSLRCIRRAVKKGNINFVHYESFIKAECAAWKGRETVSRKHYESAILLSARKGDIGTQAVVSERFGDYMLEVEDLDETEYRWKNALRLYREWGATAKVEQVEAKLRTVRSTLPQEGLRT